MVIQANGNIFKSEDIQYLGCNTIFAENVDGNIVNATLTYFSNAYNKPIWAFGDSYFEYWCKFAYNDGYKNWLVDSVSGRDSLGAIDSLEKALGFGTPSTILWCMGMNDADNGKINSNWLKAFNQLVDICNSNKIDLVLQTIPNVPSRDNTFKNNYIRNSGYEYIDIADLVSPQGNSVWYDGL